MSHRNNDFGTNMKTVLGDALVWDKLKLPLKGCSSRDPTQICRCRKHKRKEAECLLSLPEGASFLDCGAHFGDTTLTMACHARANGREDIRFITFEPSKRKCKFIRSMVKANGLQKSVKIVNACVGDTCRYVQKIGEIGFDRYDGRVAYSENDDESNEICRSDNDNPRQLASPFYYDGNFLSSCESDSESDDEDFDDNSNAESENIQMISLDSMAEEIGKLGLLHLDIEGWEARALKGASNILRGIDHTCFIIAEVWDDRDLKKRHKAVLDPRPDGEILEIMSTFSNFERKEDIVDQERNLFFATTVM